MRMRAALGWMLPALLVTGCAWRTPQVRVPVQVTALPAGTPVLVAPTSFAEPLDQAWHEALRAAGLTPASSAALQISLQVERWAQEPERRVLQWRAQRQDGGPMQVTQEQHFVSTAVCQVRVLTVDRQGASSSRLVEGLAAALPLRLDRSRDMGHWHLDGRAVVPVADTAEALLQAAARDAQRLAAAALRSGESSVLRPCDTRDGAQRRVLQDAAAGRLDEALTALRAITTAEPANAAAAYNRALVHEARSEAGEALWWYERAGTLDPTVHGEAAAAARQRLGLSGANAL